MHVRRRCIISDNKNRIESLLLLIFSDVSCMRSRLTNAGEGTVEQILLEAELLGLEENHTLKLCYEKNGWCLNGGSLIKEMPFVCQVGPHNKLLLLLSGENQNIGSTGRLRLNKGETIRIGKAFPNTIFYDCGALIADQHVSISCKEQGYYMEIQSPKGVYVNEKCTQSPVLLNTGDRIDLYGLHLVILHNWLVCVAFCGICRVAAGRQEFDFAPESRNRAAKQSKLWIERVYEEEDMLHTEELELILPAQPTKRTNNQLFLTLGPSLTMVFPVLIMAMLGQSYAGGTGNNFYYLTVVMTACGSFLAVFWGLINHFYKRYLDRSGEKNRRRQYLEYLDNTTQYLQKCREDNRRNLAKRYPPVMTVIDQEQNIPVVLWNRYYMHKDFLFWRMGTGEMPFQMKIKLSERQKHLVPEQLMAKAFAVVQEYAMLQQAPIGIDFFQIRRLGVIGQVPYVDACLRQLLLQTAMCHCYTEVKTVCFYHENVQSQRKFAHLIRWMPHSWSADRRVRFLACNEQQTAEILPVLTQEMERNMEAGEDKRRVPWYLIFVLNEELVQGELLYKYMTDASGKYSVSSIFIGEDKEKLPRSCRCFMTENGQNSEILFYGEEQVSRKEICLDITNPVETEQTIRKISGLRVKEEEAQGQLPDRVTFMGLYDCGKIEDLNSAYRWERSRPQERLKIPIGRGVGGNLVSLDVHEKFHGPHGLIAGTTGSGKSELLQTYLMSMAVSYSPQDVIFFMIDYKGGGTGNILKKLPHCAGVISNLSGRQIKRAMSAISSENKRRQQLLSEVQVNHIDAYTGLFREGKVQEPMPHLILVVDEFAELKKEEPEFMQEIISIAQVGRSLGVHLILATQKPAGTVDDKIWSNARFRLCLRVQDKQDSMDMLHCGDAAKLTTPGQCYLQIGQYEQLELFQTAYCGGEYREELEESVGAVLLSDTGKRLTDTGKQDSDTGENVDLCAAKDQPTGQMELLLDYILKTVKQKNCKSAKSLWMPELPDYLSLDQIKGIAENGGMGGTEETEEEFHFVFGLCDDPENQKQFSVEYNPLKQGHLAVFGGPATGKSTFLQTILWQLCTRHSPSEIQFLIVDISRGTLHCFEDLPHCMSILKNRDGLMIFFYHMYKLVQQRKELLAGISYLQYKKPLPLILIVVDGYGGLAQLLNEEQMDFMQKLSAEGINYGIYLLLTATGMGEIPGRLLEKIKTTIALEMSDRYQYGDVLRQYHISVYPKENVKGRGLCRLDGRILEFQSALGYDEPDDYARMCRIREMGQEQSLSEHKEGRYAVKFPQIPEHTDYAAFWENYSRNLNEDELPIGYSLTTGEIQTISLLQTCFLISGAEKTGRKNLLLTMAESLIKLNYQIICIDLADHLSELKGREEILRLTREQELRDWQIAEVEKIEVDKIECGNSDEIRKKCILIGDLTKFCTFLYQISDTSREQIHFWEDYIQSGNQNVLMIAIYNPYRDSSAAGTAFFREFTAAQIGIHLGGNAGTQRALSFDDMSYTQLNQREKPGIGYLKNGQQEETQRLLLPCY